MTLPIIIGAILLLGVILAIRLFLKRAKDQRAAHDARLRQMAQVAIAAAKKKEALSPKPPPTPAAAAVREERECPFCAELILKKARVCKHCGREVEPVA